jgi:hypothetical protein
MLDHLSFGDPIDVDMLDRESRWSGDRYPPELRRLIGARPGRARRDPVTISQQIPRLSTASRAPLA